jgi:hypothetical protein
MKTSGQAKAVNKGRAIFIISYSGLQDRGDEEVEHS